MKKLTPEEINSVYGGGKWEAMRACSIGMIIVGLVSFFISEGIVGHSCSPFECYCVNSNDADPNCMKARRECKCNHYSDSC